MRIKHPDGGHTTIADNDSRAVAIRSGKKATFDKDTGQFTGVATTKTEFDIDSFETKLKDKTVSSAEKDAFLLEAVALYKKLNY